jgi:hypothetical protein
MAITPALATELPVTVRAFETDRDITSGQQMKQLLDKQTIIDIESSERELLTFVALEEQRILVLDEKEEVVAIIVAEQLQRTVEHDETVKVVPVKELKAEIQNLAIAEQSDKLVIVLEQELIVVDTKDLLTEQVVPRVVELSVIDEAVFWQTEKLNLRDAAITEEGKILALAEKQIHVFQPLSTSAQTLQYQQVPTAIELAIANPIAIDESNGIVAIVDKDSQVLLTQTEELLENNLESVLRVPTAATPTEVEIVAADRLSETQIVVVEDDLAEKITVDMISERLVEVETLQMALTTLVEDVRVQSTASPIAVTLDQEANLLVVFDDNTIAQFDDLAIELNQPTNAISSTVKIVRSDMPALSSCSVQFVEGNASYGDVTIGQVAETQFVLQTQGNPIVSLMGSDWKTLDDVVVMNSDVTHYKLLTAEQGEEPLLTDYDNMERLQVDPVTIGQVDDQQELELFLQLKVPTTYDRETLDAVQQVSVLAEC